MGVAEKQVPHVACFNKDFCKRLRVGERDAIQRRNTNGERRMVHEQVHGILAGFRKSRRKPLATFLAIGAARTLRRLQGINEHEAAGIVSKRMLHEAMSVARGIRKRRQQLCAIVVVTGDQMYRHRQLFEKIPRRGIGPGISGIGHVARQDQKLGVVVMFDDVGDAGVQARTGIEPVEFLPACNQMGVGQVNEFHCTMGDYKN